MWRKWTTLCHKRSHQSVLTGEWQDRNAAKTTPLRRRKEHKTQSLLICSKQDRAAAVRHLGIDAP
jgi:hypothetical protein